MKIIEKMLNYAVPPEKGHIHIFTGNAYTRKDGALVMGRGAAKQVRDTYPCVQHSLGEAVRASDGAYYGLLGTNCAGHSIWVLQVKYHFKDKADPLLIRASVDDLKTQAINMPTTTFHMNYPGVGNGQLTVEEVQPILDTLPNNVLIYR